MNNDMHKFVNNLSGNNKQENQPEVKPKVEQANKGKRNFLIGVVAAGVAATLGYKTFKEEKLSNELYSSLKGQERNFQKVHEAAEMLLEVMRKNNIPPVRLSGEHPDNEVELLRTFLTRHIYSDVGHDYDVRDKLLTTGFYTKEILESISKRSLELAQKRG